MPALTAAKDFYDFYGQVMSAAIVLGPKPEDRFPLWVGPISDAAKKSAKLEGSINHLCFLNQLTVEMGLGYIPRITATLTPTYADGIAFLNSRLIEFGEHILEVQFGYVGVNGSKYLSPLYSGLILPPDVKIGASIEITVIAQGVGSFTMTRQEGSTDYKNKSVKQIVLDILKSPLAQAKGLLEQPDDSLVQDFISNPARDTGSPSLKQLYTEAISSYPRTGKSDWQLLTELLNRCMCTYSFDALDANKHKKELAAGKREQLRIIPKPTLFESKPTMKLSMYHYPGDLGPRNNLYPIVSASSPHTGIYASGVNRKYILSGVEERSKKVIYDAYTSSPKSGEQNAKKVDIVRSSDGRIEFDSAIGIAIASGANQALGPGAGSSIATAAGVAIATRAAPAASRITALQSNTIFSGDPSNPELVGMIKSQVADIAINMGVKLEIETLGVPNIRPGETVEVAGLSDRYDDVYSVFNVTHILGASGFSTRLVMYTNASKLIREGFGASAPASLVNTKTPPPNASQMSTTTAKVTKI